MPPPKSCFGFALVLLRAGVAFWLLAACALQAEPPLHQQIERQPVAQGAELIRIRQLAKNGWLNITALEIDLTEPALRIDALLGNNRLTGAQPLSRTAREAGAIAGINGDFFHIRSTDAPIGAHVQAGELFKSPPPGSELAVGFSEPEQTPFIGNLTFEGRVVSGDSDFPLNGWNAPAPGPDGLVAYNRRWDSAAPGPDGPDLFGRRGLVHAILDENQRVTRLLKGKPGPKIPDGGRILLGRGRAAAWLLANAQPGARIEIDWKLGPQPLSSAIGGRPVLLRDGEITVPKENDLHPRSAIGFNSDKTRAWWVVVDGRSALSRGMTHHELAELMREFGATDALNVDGGGSSTLLARTPGTVFPAVRNLTSDGSERPFPNGLGLFTTLSSGTMKHLLIESPAPDSPHLIGLRELRLAPGARFQPAVRAADEQRNPAGLPENIQWSVEPPELGSFSPEDVFTAASPGPGEILAKAATDDGSELTASHPLRVIGDPVELRIEPTEISARAGESVPLKVFAADIRGFAAPLAPGDLAWEIRGNIGSVENGWFHAADGSGSGALAVRFGNLRGVAPVGIGARPESLTDFQDESAWTTTAVPEQTKSELSFVHHPPHVRASRPTAKLAYDFTGTTRIRAAYLQPTGGDLRFPGRPLQIGLWVFGDGNEAWLRGQMIDSTGTARAIDFARNIDWTGWRHVEAEIPPGTSYPISLRRIYVVETRPNAHYSGAVYFDELQSVHAPEIDPSLLPELPEIRDPANQPAELSARDATHFRFIVFGDSKVEANRPDSAEATVFSALIDRINRHDDIEFVLYTGDLIENDSDANYRFGKRFLDRLRKPVRTIPANHEIAGTDNFDRYREFLGETFYNFRHGNSEFIALNTARPGLRESEPEQWPWLQEKLQSADAENIFILTHIPVVDPMPGGQTGWTDTGEIAIFQELLTKHAEKGQNLYVFHGHVHGFNRRAHDGVEYLTTAGGGSPLYLPPDQGGFYHYVVVTVAGTEVTYQVIPLLERIELPDAVEAAPGETIRIRATGVAPNQLVRFPLAYPATADWKITDETVATFDPETGELHAQAIGETLLTVHADEIQATTRVRIR